VSLSSNENAVKPNAYGEYLLISQLISLQKRRSVDENNPVHDETLFIVIHQTIELWFYQIITELKSIRASIREDDFEYARDGLVRIARIFSVLTLSWEVLSTLRVREFWEFRKYFMKDGASGLQSKQFREIEFLFGVGPKPTWVEPNGEIEARSIWDEMNVALVRRKVMASDDLAARDWATPYPYASEDDDGNISGDPKIEAAWFEIYDTGAHPDFYQLGELMLDVASALGVWRAKHIATVQRFIGDLRGSGNTEGVRYLRRTLKKRAFPELWSVRNQFGRWLSDTISKP
jgi:tryptophan 2,3-dioxygenase